MTWERLDENQFARRDDPQLSIYPKGSGRFNVVARERWFEDIDELAVYGDPDADRLAFEPADEGHTTTLREDGELHLKRALDEILGADVDAIEETGYADLQEDETTGYIVADVSHLPGLGDETDEETTAGEADQKAPDEEAPFACPECGDEFDSERGRNIHQGRVHDTDDDAGDGGGAEDENATGEDSSNDYDNVEGGTIDGVDLSVYGDSGQELTAGMVTEALTGAQTVHQVQRELRLGRHETEGLLEGLGVLEELQDGSPKLEESEAAAIVREAIADG